MTKPVRLLCAQDLERPDDIYAIDLDTKQECIINRTEAAEFMAECATWDADSFDAGRCIQVGMSADNWQLWLDGYMIVSPLDYVALTVSKSGERHDCLSVLSLKDKHEAIAPPKEVAYLVKDCHGWDGDRLGQGHSIAVLMATDDWQSWLQTYEVGDGSESEVLLTQ